MPRDDSGRPGADIDKTSLPFHGSDGAARHLAVAIALAVSALVAALATWGFFSVVWFLTHSD